MGIVITHGGTMGAFADGYKSGQAGLANRQKEEAKQAALQAEAEAKEFKSQQMRQAMDAVHQQKIGKLKADQASAVQDFTNPYTANPNQSPRRTGERGSKKEYDSWLQTVQQQRAQLQDNDALEFFDESMSPEFESRKEALDQEALGYAIENYIKMGIIPPEVGPELQMMIQDGTPASEVRQKIHDKAGQWTARQDRDRIIQENVDHLNEVLKAATQNAKTLEAAGRPLAPHLAENLRDAKTQALHMQVALAGDPDMNAADAVKGVLEILDRKDPKAQALSDYADKRIGMLRQQLEAIDPFDLMEDEDGNPGPAVAKQGLLLEEIKELEKLIGGGEENFPSLDIVPNNLVTMPGMETVDLGGSTFVRPKTGATPQAEAAVPPVAEDAVAPVAPAAGPPVAPTSVSEQLRNAEAALQGEESDDGLLGIAGTDARADKAHRALWELDLDVSPEVLEQPAVLAQAVTAKYQEIKKQEEEGNAPVGAADRAFGSILTLMQEGGADRAERDEKLAKDAETNREQTLVERSRANERNEREPRPGQGQPVFTKEERAAIEAEERKRKRESKGQAEPVVLTHEEKMDLLEKVEINKRRKEDIAKKKAAKKEGERIKRKNDKRRADQEKKDKKSGTRSVRGRGGKQTED